MTWGGSIQAVRRSSFAVVRQHDSTAPNRDSRSRHSTPSAELSALESRSARHSPTTLLVRAWRSLIELRIEDALTTLAQFDDEIARADDTVAPRSREFAKVLRAVLLVLKSQNCAIVRTALAVLENRHELGGKSPALAAALRVG